MLNNTQKWRFDVISTGRHSRYIGILKDGLSKCCQSPRILKLITNGIRTEKCGNCGAEANVE